MTPTVFRQGPYRFFFFSREETRMHVHVSHPDGEAKFWLAPHVELAKQLVVEHLQEIVDAWNKYFGG